MMRRVVLGLAVALGVVAWAADRPGEKPTDPTLAEDLGDIHSASSAEYRYHSSAHTHWRQVALNR
jgi:hypothetical protein